MTTDRAHTFLATHSREILQAIEDAYAPTPSPHPDHLVALSSYLAYGPAAPLPELTSIYTDLCRLGLAIEQRRPDRGLRRYFTPTKTGLFVHSLLTMQEQDIRREYP